MAIRFAKNISATTYERVAQALFEFFRTILGSTTILQTTGTWNVTSFGSDGSVNSGSPQTFVVTTPQFFPAHVGFSLAVRDPLNALNSGIFLIVAVAGDNKSCTLFAPIANFPTTASGLSWSLHDPATLPAVGDSFVIAQPTSAVPPWQAKIVVLALGVEVTFSPRGGYNTTTSLFTLPTLPVMILGAGALATNVLFIMGDDVEGWFTTWDEDGNTPADNRNVLHAGNINPFHFVGTPGLPQDDVMAGAFGSQAFVADNSRTDPTIVNSIAADGSMLDTDKITPTSAQFGTLTVFGGFVDLLADVAFTTNPRTTQSDDYPIIITQTASTPPDIRGFLKGVRGVNTSLANRTLVSGSTVYVIKKGVACPWDGTVPV